MRRRALLAVMASGGLSVLLAACGPMSAPDTGSTTPERPAPTATATPSEDVRATVEDLQQHLTRQSHGLGGFLGAPAPGGDEPEAVITCQGSGPVRGGDTITCRWEAALPADVDVWGCENPPVDGCGGGQWPDPQTVLVSVLDDTGRYTFTLLDDNEDAQHASPGDYPEGTTACPVLAAPPASGRARDGLSYPALLHHWMSLGRPASMDSDGDGQPCEDSYPAEIVPAVLGSPLAPVGDPDTPPLTMDDVRAHAQAHMTGYFSPVVLSGTGGDQPATTGTTMACEVYSPSTPGMMRWQLYLIVLDDTGGYLIVPDTAWLAPACPGLDDYPEGSACAELAEPPPGWTTCSRGVSYGEALYQWFSLGRPTDWDVDGDGRPCEDVYSEVGAYPSDDSLLRP